MCWSSLSVCMERTFDRCSSYAASCLSSPHSLTHSLSCWRSTKVMYCLHSFVNLARPLQPVCHIELNHCRILISLWEQRPQCRRRTGQRAMRCMKTWLSCYVSLWWFYYEGSIWRRQSVVGIIRKGWNKGRLWVWSSFSQAGSQFLSPFGSQACLQVLCLNITQSTSQLAYPAIQ